MNSSVEKKYRNSTQITCDLLTVTQDSGQNGIAVTVLCQKGNLSHSRLRNILSKLTGSGLVNEIEFDESKFTDEELTDMAHEGVVSFGLAIREFPK